MSKNKELTLNNRRISRFLKHEDGLPCTKIIDEILQID